jgi:PAS domain-containing protein
MRILNSIFLKLLIPCLLLVFLAGKELVHNRDHLNTINTLKKEAASKGLKTETLLSRLDSMELEYNKNSANVFRIQVFCIMLSLGLVLYSRRKIKKYLGADPEDLKQILKSMAQGTFDIRFLDEYFEPSGLIKQLLNLSNNLRSHRQKLALNEQRFRKIFDNNGVGLFRCSLDGFPQMVNKKTALLLGFRDPDELVHHIPTSDLGFFASKNEQENFAKLVLAGAYNEGKPAQIYCKDNSVLYVHLYAVIGCDESGHQWAECGIIPINN